MQTMEQNIRQYADNYKPVNNWPGLRLLLNIEASEEMIMQMFVMLFMMREEA